MLIPSVERFIQNSFLIKLSTLYSIFLIIPEADEADDNGKYNNHYREYKIETSEKVCKVKGIANIKLKFANLKQSRNR